MYLLIFFKYSFLLYDYIIMPTYTTTITYAVSFYHFIYATFSPYTDGFDFSFNSSVSFLKIRLKSL